MVGFYQMVTQDFNVQTRRVKVPSHKSMELIHNKHFQQNLTVADAISRGLNGYEVDDWIDKEQLMKAVETNNHWMVVVFPVNSKTYYVYSASEVDVLLEYVSNLSHWRDGEP